MQELVVKVKDKQPSAASDYGVHWERLRIRYRYTSAVYYYIADWRKDITAALRFAAIKALFVRCSTNLCLMASALLSFAGLMLWQRPN